MALCNSLTPICAVLQSVNEVTRLREAEVTHGRVAMAAAAGFLAQETWHFLLPSVQGAPQRGLECLAALLTSFRFCGPAAPAGPSIIHFQQVPGPYWWLLFGGIGAVEYVRARRGWVEPWRALFRLREEYRPGARTRTRSLLARIRLHG